MFRIRRIGRILIGWSLACGACASDTSATSLPSAQAGSPATAGAGAAGAGETEWFKRRASPGEVLPSDYSLQACPGVTPDASATAGMQACNDICGRAHCVDARYAGGEATLLPNCPSPPGAAASKCIPDSVIELGGKFVYRTCDAGGARGACVPGCLVLDLGAVWLVRDVCAEGELCAPCSEETCADRCTGNFPSFRM